MSGSISQVPPSPGGSSGFAMNPAAQADLAGGVAQFNSMVQSGNITDIKSSLQNLQAKIGSDVTDYFGQNGAGLNAESYKDLSGAQYQLGQLAPQLGSGASSLANLSKFGQTLESALAPPQQPAVSADASAAGPAGGVDGGDSMSGIAQQVVELLQQALQQLGQGGAQGAGQGGAQGAPASGGSPPSADGASQAAAAGPSAEGGSESIIQELLKVLEQMVQQLGHGSAEGAGSPEGAGGQPSAPAGGESDELSKLKEALGPLIQKLGGQPSPAASPAGPGAASTGPSGTEPGSQAAGSSGNSHQAEMMQMMSELLQVIMQMMQTMNGPMGASSGGTEA